MPFALKLPEPWASRGWKAKIRDRERLEPPHVTILHKTSAWRFELRSEKFLDREPDPPGRTGGSRWRRSLEPRLTSAGVGPDVSGEPRFLREAQREAQSGVEK